MASFEGIPVLAEAWLMLPEACMLLQVPCQTCSQPNLAQPSKQMRLGRTPGATTGSAGRVYDAQAAQARLNSTPMNVLLLVLR